jgi:hypothetical protein
VICSVLASVRFGPDEIDVELPAHTPLAGILPELDALGPPLSGGRTHVGIARPSGSSLELGMTLAQCGIEDGAILVMVSDPPSSARRTQISIWNS